MQGFWLVVHRWSGLLMVVFLTIAGVTGCVLVFRGPLDRALNPHLFAVEGALPTDPSRAVAAAQAFAAAHPQAQVTQFPLQLPAGRSLPLKLDVVPGSSAPAADEVFVDPSDGHVVGARTTGPGWDPPHFVQGVSQLHFTLLAGTLGRWLLGVVAFVWLLSNCIGAWLTWPEKRPYWQQWKRNWQFRRSSKLPRLLLDLHRSSGLWLFPFLLLLAGSSAAINFFAEVWEPMVTAASPLKRDLFDHETPFPEGAKPTLTMADGLAAAQKLARDEGLQWRPAAMLYLPQWNFYGVKFSPDGVLDYRALGPVDYYVDARTGAFRHKVDPYDDSMGLALIRVLYPLHSGEIFGPLSVALVFVLGLVTVGQGATGVYVWWKKRKSRVAQKAAARKRIA